MSEKECDATRLQVDIGPWSFGNWSESLQQRLYLGSLQTSHCCFRHGDKADEYKEQFQELQDAYERICRHVVTRTSENTWALEFRFGGGLVSMRVESFYMDEVTLHKCISLKFLKMMKVW